MLTTTTGIVLVLATAVPVGASEIEQRSIGDWPAAITHQPPPVPHLPHQPPPAPVSPPADETVDVEQPALVDEPDDVTPCQPSGRRIVGGVVACVGARVCRRRFRRCGRRRLFRRWRR